MSDDDLARAGRAHAEAPEDEEASVALGRARERAGLPATCIREDFSRFGYRPSVWHLVRGVSPTNGGVVTACGIDQYGSGLYGGGGVAPYVRVGPYGESRPPVIQQRVESVVAGPVAAQFLADFGIDAEADLIEDVAARVSAACLDYLAVAARAPSCRRCLRSRLYRAVPVSGVYGAHYGGGEELIPAPSSGRLARFLAESHAAGGAVAGPRVLRAALILQLARECGGGHYRAVRVFRACAAAIGLDTETHNDEELIAGALEEVAAAMRTAGACTGVAPAP